MPDQTDDQKASVDAALASIAANIRRLRLKRGWTQEMLAGAAAMEPRYLQTLEAGAGNPSAAVLTLLAGALGVSPGVLFRPARPQKRRTGRPAKQPGAKASAGPKRPPRPKAPPRG